VAYDGRAVIPERRSLIELYGPDPAGSTGPTQSAVRDEPLAAARRPVLPPVREVLPFSQDQYYTMVAHVAEPDRRGTILPALDLSEASDEAIASSFRDVCDVCHRNWLRSGGHGPDVLGSAIKFGRV
jgi:hypothetical protein